MIMLKIEVSQEAKTEQNQRRVTEDLSPSYKVTLWIIE